MIYILRTCGQAWSTGRVRSDGGKRWDHCCCAILTTENDLDAFNSRKRQKRKGMCVYVCVCVCVWASTFCIKELAGMMENDGFWAGGEYFIRNSRLFDVCAFVHTFIRILHTPMSSMYTYDITCKERRMHKKTDIHEYILNKQNTIPTKVVPSRSQTFR